MKNKLKMGALMSTVILTIFIFFDYINLPYTLGISIANMNYSFWELFILIALYIITYKILDKKACEKEKNKSKLSLLLIKRCYEECIKYVDILNDEVIEKYIVPKIDFDSTNNKVIRNLQSAPFENESVIMDLVKDGQVDTKKIENFFKIKDKYKQYVNVRVTFFDGPCIFNPLKEELLEIVNEELKAYTDK